MCMKVHRSLRERSNREVLWFCYQWRQVILGRAIRRLIGYLGGCAVGCLGGYFGRYAVGRLAGYFGGYAVGRLAGFLGGSGEVFCACCRSWEYVGTGLVNLLMLYTASHAALLRM